MFQPLRFHAYTPELAPAFKAINVEWLNAMFEVEESDLATLDHPGEIVAHDGEIWFAERAFDADPEAPIDLAQVVGCCALKRILPPLAEHDEGLFELTKMGVLEKARGQQIGEPLLLHVLERAKANPHVKRLFLLTNTKCEAAIHLYEKHGWRHSPELLERFGHVYVRANVGMIYPEVWSPSAPPTTEKERDD